ncbi:MAG TPA: hypothetical protein PLF40_19955 [Kofleriaceae bacterium]|nr:hypothetical protein [Kofleriaceae bacterium]
MTSIAGLVMVSAAATVAMVSTATADSASDRAAISDGLGKLSSNASALAAAAKKSEDRAVRKKFAPKAEELSDDLASLAKRAGKDVALASIGKEAADIGRDAAALIELADEAEDKDERKSLRAQAVLIEQGLGNVRKLIDAAASKGDDKPAAPKRFTGRLVNSTDKCEWIDHVVFTLSRDGAQVFKSTLVPPGKQQPLVLDAGDYAISIGDTAGTIYKSATFKVSREGWVWDTGCYER